MLDWSRVRLTSPWLSVLMAPVKEELFLRFRVRLEMESTTMLPEDFWFVRS